MKREFTFIKDGEPVLVRLDSLKKGGAHYNLVVGGDSLGEVKRVSRTEFLTTSFIVTSVRTGRNFGGESLAKALGNWFYTEFENV